MSLTQRLLSRYLAAGDLFSLDIELTYRCPLRCRHCYQHGMTRSELPTGEWLRVLEEARSLNVFNIGFTGGEVFVREDFPILLERAASLGLRIFVNTSGNMAKPEAVAALIAARPAQVDISFYSADEAVHDAVTQRPGSFGLSLGLARRLLDAGLFARAAVTPLAGYAEDFNAVAEGLRARGLPHVALNRFDPTLCADPAAVAHLVPRRPQSTGCLVSIRSETSAGEDQPVCGAGTSSLLAGPDGSVTPCHGIPTVVGDLARQSLNEIWRASPELARYKVRRRADLTRCAACSQWEACGFCPAEAQRRTGDWRGVDEAYCLLLQEGEEGS